MSFPISPSNGAQTTVNGITYTYRASTRSWLRVQAGLSSIEILGNLTAGNLFINNTGDVSANIGAFYTYANTTFTTLDANVGTLFLGNSSTNANLGAFREYANTKIGSNADGNLVTNGNVISNLYYSSGGTSRFALSDIGLVTIDVASQQYKFGASGIEANPGIFGGSYGGNKLSLNNETALISNRYDTVTIQTGTDGSAQNTWTFGNSALTAPGRITASGNIIANSGVASTSNVTGALVVRGGVGVAGNVYANTIYTTTGIRWAGNGAVFSSGSGGGGGASALDDLTDVIITSPTTSQVLKYNGTNWINAADATGGGGGGGITYTSDTTSPAFPNIGDQWYDTSTDILYEYIEDGISSYWVDVQSPMFSSGITNSVVGNVNITGPTSSIGHLTVARTATIAGNIITLANINVSRSANILGNLTVGGNVAFSRDAAITANLTVDGNIASGNITTANISATGNITTTDDISATTVLSANITVTSNVTTANISATDISSTGNITSGNIATGNLTASNIASSELTTSGNTTAGNLAVTGNVILTGANVYLGNVANLSIAGGASGQYLQTDGAGDLSWQTPPATNIQEFTATTSQTTFTVIGTYTVGSVLVFVNGIQMNSADYTATDGTTVVLTEARNFGDTVRVVASFGAASLVSGLTLNINNLQTFSVAMSVAMGI